MSASASNGHKIAFILTEDKLRSLDNQIKHNLGDGAKIEYELTFPDGISVAKTELDSIIHTLNSTALHVKQLRLIWRDDSGKRIQLSLHEQDALRGTVEYFIDSSETEIFGISEQIKGFMKTIKPWYSRLAYADFVSIALLLVILGFATLLILSAIAAAILLASNTNVATDSNQESSSLVSSLVTSLIFIVPIVFVLVAFALDKIRHYIFPKGVFAIGFGKERYDRIRFIRNVVIGGSIGTIVLGVIASYIFQSLQSG
ncbi:MAG: hypothetical protein H6670_12795 [Anaerolineaceae bacterium]|nr:hypothetical protein [Anaerolineaceae bacterium]